MVNRINNNFSEAIKTEIRDDSSTCETIRTSLSQLGMLFGQEIIGGEYVTLQEITTSQNVKIIGNKIVNKKTLIISTRDDYRFFAAGIAYLFKDCLMAYMDFGGKRGLEALTHPVRAMSLPELRHGEQISTVIVAKSVLATGCTAISLLRKAMSEYFPDDIYVCSAFYTEKGIRELTADFPKVKIYVTGEPDMLDNNEMLLPGIGDLDSRVNTDLDWAK
jgi:uracil phosphoribosyltransferase